MFTIQNIEPEAKFGDYTFKLELNHVSDFAQEVAKTDLRESPENIENGLRELRKLLKEETNLHVPLDNDKWLLGFLRICKFYPESARDKIKTYFNFRQRYADVFKNATPKRLKRVFDMSTILVLPKRDQHGRRIILMLSGKRWDHKIVHKDEFFLAAGLCHELCRMEPDSQINGLVAITDMEGLTFEQAMKFTPNYSKRNVESYRDGASFRPKDLHFVNEPDIFHKIFNLALPLMSKKLGKRTHFHGTNMESLHKFISPDCLPECYGGTLKLDLNYGPELYELLSLFEEDFENNLQYGYATKK